MRFQILGPLRVSDGDDREIALGGAKPAAVLAMLIVNANELVSSDRLIEDLWDGQPPPTANKTLQVHVSRLRRALGEASNGAGIPVVTQGGGYVLQAGPDEIDAVRFERQVEEGCAALAEGAHARASARLRGALALWRGRVLSDFTYASFAQDPIARLEGLKTVALESAIEAELALGRHAELIPELKSLLKQHPLSERLRGQLMLALYRSGRQAEALGVYRAGRRILVDRLGIEPSAELRELERAILAQDAGIAAPSAERRPSRPAVVKSSGGPFVGYEHELAALEEALEQALTGRGALALISGEPGVGKTRLADELAAVARARGADVVWARSWEDGGAPPFWSWIQALRTLISDRGPANVRAELGPDLGELAQLLPELRELVPAGAAADESDPDAARFRLYSATASFLRRSAAAQPLVVVLDDLHAADQSSLALLRFIAGAVVDAPVLLVATYRDTEVFAGDPLSDTLNELTRAADCLQLVLTGLSIDDTAHFIEVSAGVAPMPALAAAIHRASSGNPLFVTELVRLLRAEDRLEDLDHEQPLQLPRGLDQVIARRLHHLSDSCRRTLSDAAVIGAQFDVAVLGRVTDTAGDQLLEDLGDAVAMRVIEEVPGGRGTFRFSHDLVRQALYARLGPAERARAHAGVAAALEEVRGPDARPVELAHHWAEALPGADPTKAIHYLMLAADEAADLTAYHDAAGYYERAVAIARETGDDPSLLCELLVRLAEQLVSIPDPARATAAAAEAETLAATGPDLGSRARLEVVAAHLDFLDACVVDQATLDGLIDQFHQAGDALNEAKAWWALFLWRRGRNRNDQALAAAEGTLACARRAGSGSLLAQALRGIASSLANGTAPISEASARIRALLPDSPDDKTKAKMYAALAELEAGRGRFNEARALLATARTLTPRAFEEFECGCVYSALRVERLARNPQAAEEWARRVCAHSEAEGLLTYLATDLSYLIDALTEQGRLAEAAAELARAVSIVRDDDPDALFRQARSRALLELARGEVAAAEASIRAAVEHAAEIEAAADRAETLLTFAEILFAAERDSEARDVAEEVVRIAEAREHEVFAHRARQLLSANGSAPASRSSSSRLFSSPPP